ncbi:MAG: rod shape-determining protein MreC [Lachnospirales bacterium]
MNFIKKNKVVFIWFVVILSVIAMILTVGNRYSPQYFSSIVSFPMNSINKIIEAKNNFVLSRGEIEKLKEDNLRLTEENIQLNIENDKLELLEQENIELSDLLDTSRSYPEYNKITTSVIGKEISNWYDKFYIDAGLNQGVKKNMVVIAAGGLVGHISKVSSNYAEVKTIIDDTSTVSGMITRSSSLGFVKGDNTLRNDNLIRMEFFDIDAEVLENDEVITSHLSSIYPKGISIGYVKKVTSDDAGLYKYAYVTPYVDFTDLKKVIVILDDFSNSYKEEFKSRVLSY